MPKSFDYLVNPQTKILVIGSMPGMASLNAQEYYAHPYNLFWKFIYEAFETEFNNPTYEEKIDLLFRHHIGLWDAAKSCARKGSSDTNITAVTPNNFNLLLNRYPNILKFLFNGKKAFELFKKYHSNLLEVRKYTVLPSTSPANAGISYELKKNIWINELKSI